MRLRMAGREIPANFAPIAPNHSMMILPFLFQLERFPAVRSRSLERENLGARKPVNLYLDLPRTVCPR